MFVRRTRALLITAMLAMVVAVAALAGCSSDSGDAHEGHSSSPAASRTEQHSSGPSSSMAGGGQNCGEIPDAIGRPLPVSVTIGTAECGQALAIARKYIDTAAANAQGSGRFLTVDGWECSREYLEGRSGADDPLQCTSLGGTRIRLGK